MMARAVAEAGLRPVRAGESKAKGGEKKGEALRAVCSGERARWWGRPGRHLAARRRHALVTWRASSVAVETAQRAERVAAAR
jgi:hypothetical protein